MDKHQIMSIYPSNSLKYTFGDFCVLLLNFILYIFETGIFASLLFIALFQKFFQMNKLNIPTNFKHNKTLHI